MSNAKNLKKEISSFWNHPWGYEQFLLIMFSLWFVGFQLEYFTHGGGKYFLKYPLNLIFIGIWHVLSIIFYFIFPRLVKTILSREFMFTSVGGMIFLCLIAGIIPGENQFKNDFIFRIGLKRILNSWPYVFTFLMVSQILFFAILKRLFRFSKKEIIFLLNHIGLWIILVAATFGSGDRISKKMNLYEGKATWEAYDENNRFFALPFALYLKDFVLTEHPPEIALFDSSFKMLKKKKTSGLKEEKIVLKNFEIIFDEVNRDSIYFNNTWKIAKHPGSVWHAQVSVWDKRKKQKLITGDISSSSFMQEEKNIIIGDDQYILKYLPSRPKKFSSFLKIYTPNGEVFEKTLEVNHPTSFGQYKIYQHSYDDKLGAWSELSVVELIYDPWINMVYLGIICLLLGSMGFMFFPNKGGAK